MFLLDALFAFLYLTFTTEKDIYKRIIISLIPNIIIYTATIPLVILISAPFYGTARYVQLLAEHFLLLNTVTKATAALLFYVTSVKMRSTAVPFSLKEYLIIIATLMICDVIYISLLNVVFFEHYDGVSIAAASVAVAGLLITAFFAFMDLAKLIEDHTKLKIDHAVLENERRMNRQLLASQDELYRLRHDLKHFVNLAINSQFDDPNYTGMAEKYRDISEKTAVPVNTKSKALNYVFTIKKKEALDKGIEFFSVINIEDQITMDDTDLCLLVSNLLDNAIRHVGIRNKIFTEIICGRGQLMIRITNSIDKKVLDDDHQLIIEKAEGHGYGISTVRTLLDRYKGDLYFDENEGSQVTIVTVPM